MPSITPMLYNILPLTASRGSHHLKCSVECYQSDAPLLCCSGGCALVTTCLEECALVTTCLGGCALVTTCLGGCALVTTCLGGCALVTTCLGGCALVTTCLGGCALVTTGLVSAVVCWSTRLKAPAQTSQTGDFSYF